MKFFSPNGHFCPHIGSVECKGLITAKNSTLKTKTGLVKVKIMTKYDQNAKLTKMLKNLKKKDYFGKSTLFSLLVYTVVSNGSVQWM